MPAKQTTRLNARLDPETRQMLEELADHDGLSISAYLRRLIREIYRKTNGLKFKSSFVRHD